MATQPTRRSRGVLVACLAAMLVAGCLGGSPPPSQPPAGAVLAPATPTPAPADLFRFAISSDPTAFAPGASDPGTRLVDRFLFSALYRLNERLVPVPDLAAAAPSVSPDGRTWTIALQPGRTFSDGAPLSAADVVRTYQLALSPNCPFGALCALAQGAIVGVASEGPGLVVFSLKRPWAPLWAEVLARLGILSASALDASLARLLAGAQAVSPATVTGLTGRIAAATNADACLVAQPPPACDLAEYVPELESLLRSAGLPLPDPARSLGPDGRPDRTAYGGALFAKAQALGTALSASGIDRLAAAFPILDLQQTPVSSGPFRLARYVPGAELDLVRWGPSPGPGAPGRIRVSIIPDPAVASTALQTGDLDWLPSVSVDQLPAINSIPGLRAAARPSGTYREIVFNVRPGHPYADPTARLAFATCLNRAADLTAPAGGAAILANGPVPPGSWATDQAPVWPAYDPARARTLLEVDGWTLGSDGVFAKGGLRLASDLYVRASRPDLTAFATAAAVQLKACGIELDVRPLDETGQLLLAELEYPNAFETLLISRPVGVDPDADLGLLGSSHVTSAANPADANVGGWSDPAADALLAAGRASSDQAARALAYRQLQSVLAQQLPVLPLEWEPAYAAISSRVTFEGRPVDLALAGYDRNVLSWRLHGP